MPSNGLGSLWVGTTGLKASSNAINTTANNLANVNTAGYVRQQVLQADATYIKVSEDPAISVAQMGIGVKIADVVHTRDEFLDKYYRTENGRQAFYNCLSDTIDEVETIFQELEGEQFQNALTDFEVACEELAKDPSSSVNQEMIVQKATLFLSRAQAVRKSLTDYQSNLNTQVTDTINKINGIAEKICDLNVRISKVEAGNVETAYDLRDERDNLLDELSKYVKISYKELDDHTVQVAVEGVEFIDISRYHKIDATKDSVTGYVNPTWSHLSGYDGGDIKYLYNLSRGYETQRNTDVGFLKSLLYARGDKEANYMDRNTDVLTALGITTGSTMGDTSIMVETLSKLDTLIHSITTTVNDVFSPLTDLTEGVTYKNGAYTLVASDASGNMVAFRSTTGFKVWDEENGPLGIDGEGPGEEVFSRLFTDRYTEITVNGNRYYLYNEEDPADTTTWYTTDNLQVNPILQQDATYLPFRQDKDVDYAMGTKLASIWNEDQSELGGRTFMEYYESIVNSIADQGDIFKGKSDTLASSVATLENKRQEVIGVSSDEELSNLIRFQSAYNAASRYINVVSEMTELLVTQLI